MNFKHLILSALLAVTLPLMAKDLKVDNVKYQITNAYAYIADAKKATGDFVIPEKITDPKTGQQYTVVEILKEAFKDSKITSVEMPNTIIEMGNRAFENCAELTKVKLSDKIATIPSSAFYNCAKLESINFDNILEIKGHAFANCNLKSLTIPANTFEIGVFAFSDNKNLKTVVLEGLSVDSLATRNKEAGRDYLSHAYTSQFDNILYFQPYVFSDCPITNLYINRSFADKDRDGCPPMPPFNKLKNLSLVEIGPLTQSIPMSAFDGSAGARVLVKCDAIDLESIYRFKQIAGLEYNKDTSKPGAVPVYLQDASGKMVNADEALKLEKYYTGVENFNKYVTNDTRKANIDGSGTIIDSGILASHLNEYQDMLDFWIDEYFEPNKNNLTKDNANMLEIMNEMYLLILNSQSGRINEGTNAEWVKQWLNREKPAEHTVIYNRILDNCNILHKQQSVNYPYVVMQQLIALIGLGREKEAAAYYPTAWNIITENGLYGVLPPEFVAVKDYLVNKGYNVSSGAKTTTKKSGVKSKSSNDNGLMEFIIEQGWKAYKEHRDYRRFKKWLKKNGQI